MQIYQKTCIISCVITIQKIEELTVHLPPFPMSNAISPIRFEKDIAMDFFTYLKDEKNMMVNPVGGDLGKCSIRVAHHLTYPAIRASRLDDPR